MDANKTLKLFFKSRYSRLVIIGSLLFLILMGNLQVAFAAPSIMTRYVGIDSVSKTSYVYDENFMQFPDNPFIPNTSVEALPANKVIWYTGTSIDVIRRNDDGSIDVVSDEPAYSEMVHHMVWGYRSPNRIRDYKCGIARPLATGSELNDFNFPKGYAYKLHGGIFMPVSWHWENPGAVSLSEKIYLRFNLFVDDSGANYKDFNIDWIDTVPCKSAFTTPPGESKIIGAKHRVNTTRRIVGVVPHIHDHSKKFKLKSSHGTVRTFRAEYQSVPVAHDDRGQGPTLWHVDKDHLPVNGLTNWSPGIFGPVIKAGDDLWMESKFKNPHPRNIDNMAIAVIFWVPVVP